MAMNPLFRNTRIEVCKTVAVPSPPRPEILPVETITFWFQILGPDACALLNG